MRNASRRQVFSFLQIDKIDVFLVFNVERQETKKARVKQRAPR